jgi:hypothetical protein
MSLPQIVTEPHVTTPELLFIEMSKRLRLAACRDIRNKLKSGEITFTNGRFTGECLQVERPPRR